MDKPIIAFMYDFDKTLSTKDMQEYTFIPSVDMDSKAFWNEANTYSQTFGMDKILAYMYLMIEKSNASKKSIRRQDFVELGKDIQFFEGVTSWFERINAYGKSKGLEIEHYIISSGLKEIVEGSSISSYFKEIYACEFFYNHNQIACWPNCVVNYTTKTQFLFRINKGTLDIKNDEEINEFIAEEKRRIPFRNMIYFGDGLTDVPCMKLVKVNGGHSIGIYQEHSYEKVKKLLVDGRVNFIADCDYRENQMLDKITKQILDKLTLDNQLKNLHHQQLKEKEYE